MAGLAYQPAVVIGLGGLGTHLASEVKQRVESTLDGRVAAGDLTRDQANEILQTRLQFIGFDTLENSNVPGLTMSAFVGGRGVNARLKTLVDQDGDAARALRAWFEFTPIEGRDQVWDAGDFIDGAGHIRMKGRLAVWLDEQAGGRPFAAIDQAIQATTRVLTREGGRWSRVKVFVIGSLSGGTSGGTLLPVLQYLAGLKYAASPISVQVFIPDEALATIGSSPNQAAQERSNHFGGLLELDAWMMERSNLTNHWRPFLPFQEGAHDAALEGHQRPADVVWLMGPQNLTGALVAGEFDPIARGISDAVATLILSDTSGSIGELDSDVVAWLDGVGNSDDTNLGRPQRYGSLGVAHVEFSKQHLFELLGTRFGQYVIETYAETPPPSFDAKEAAGSFIREREVRFSDMESALGQALNALPDAPNLGEELEFESDPVATTVAARQQLLSPSGRIGLGADEIGAAASALAAETRAALRARISERIRTDPHGFQAARALVAEMVVALDDQQREIDSAMARDSRERVAIDETLSDDAGAVASRFSLRSRARRAASFVSDSWAPFVRLHESRLLQEGAKDVIAGLQEEADLIGEVLTNITEVVAEARKQLAAREAGAGDAPVLSTSGGFRWYALRDADKLWQEFGAFDQRGRQTTPPTSAATRMHDDADGGIGVAFDELYELVSERRNRQADELEVRSRRAKAAEALTQVLIDAGSDHYLNQGETLEYSIWEALRSENDEPWDLSADQLEDRIVDRLTRTLVAGAQPLYPFVNSQMSAREPTNQPDHQATLAFEEEALDAFAAKYSLNKGSLLRKLSESVSSAFSGVVRTVRTNDPLTISLIYRTYGWALLATDTGRLASMSDDYTNYLRFRPGPVADSRARELPTDFEPYRPRPVDYVLALAFGFGIVSHPEGADGNPNRVTLVHERRDLQPPYLRNARGIDSVRQNLASTEHREWLTDLANDVRDELASPDHPWQRWKQDVEEARAVVVNEFQSAAPGSPRYRALEQMVQAISYRLEATDQFNPDNPSQDDVRVLNIEQFE